MNRRPRSVRAQAILFTITLATALATLATAGVGVYLALQNKQDIQSIHISINSRMDELLEVTRRRAHQEGVIEGEGK